MIRKFIPNRLVNVAKHLPEAIIANCRYGFAGRKMKVIGVTGSDGKTTTVNMLYKILKDAGKKVSMISTINASIGNEHFDTGFHVTNPSSSDLQKFLRQSYQNGDEFMVLEVTSHGLDQFRVWGIPFEIGIITNITHEHLDYHRTFDKYVQAKCKLIKNSKIAILNKTDANFETLKKVASGIVITFPFDFLLKLKVPGKYNIMNAQAAAAAARVLGLDNNSIRKSLETFLGLPGRLEEINNKSGIKVIIDFAHTPNALEQALKTLRPDTPGRLIAVFGCAGARDRAKRPMMGKIAAEIANVIILTDEDPRFEDRNTIIEAIAEGAASAGAKEGLTLFREPDRTRAIKLAIKMAKMGDTVGIFGKGHEKSMNYLGIERPWSDQKTAISALQDAKQ